MNPHPHELAPLLLALGRAGIELAPHPTLTDRVRHRPADLPPDLSARLRLHRAAVVRLLADGYAPDADGDTDPEYVLAERLGVADGLGMPTHPGAPAWLVAVGESMGDNCLPTTTVVHCGHGKTCGCDPAGGRDERQDPLSDRQGIGRIGGSTVAAGER